MKLPKILFVASEMTPIAKVGGLADVVGALPKVLNKKKTDCRIILPRYQDINKKDLKSVAKKIEVKFGQVSELVDVFSIDIDGVTVYLIDNDKYLSYGGIYLDKSAFVKDMEEIKRFLFFSQAVVKVLPKLKFKPDVIHCHDWHTSFIPAFLKLNKINIKTVLTIHNLANQGLWRAEEILKFLGLKGDEWGTLGIREKDGSLNIFKQGILNANKLTTVSPTYAQEILTPELGMGLENEMNLRNKDLIGILNGIDTERFDPANDDLISFKYSLKSLNAREKNKIKLTNHTNLKISPFAPLFGFVGRLATPDQKGVELLMSVIDIFVKNNAGLIMLGSGDDKHEALLRQIAKNYPNNFFPFIGFDAKFAQLMYAGCDYMLVPSKFEPCGLVQMIAMRYGSVPVVRRTGGLADSVEDAQCLHHTCQGTGIVFQDFNQHDLRDAITRACSLFHKKHLFRIVKTNAMQADFSWGQSAEKYIGVYKELLK